jgi:hypothetical protein
MSNYGPKDAGLHPSGHSRAGQALFLYRFSEDAEPIERRGAGTELRKAVGELLICLFCLGPWVAAFFAYWLVLAPALTRFVASVFAVVTVSDFLHQAYTAAKERA